MCLGGSSEGEEKDNLKGGEPPGLGLGQLDEWWCHQWYQEGRRGWFAGNVNELGGRKVESVILGDIREDE